MVFVAALSSPNTCRIREDSVWSVSAIGKPVSTEQYCLLGNWNLFVRHCRDGYAPPKAPCNRMALRLRCRQELPTGVPTFFRELRLKTRVSARAERAQSDFWRKKTELRGRMPGIVEYCMPPDGGWTGLCPEVTCLRQRQTAEALTHSRTAHSLSFK